MTVSGGLTGNMSKVQEFVDQLRLLAQEQGPHAKLPTARELCLQFSISRATLDAGLDQLEREQVIYRKDRSGIFVSPKVHHKFIAVLLNPWLYDMHSKENSPFWSILWWHIMIEAQQRSALYNETYNFYLAPPSEQPGGILSNKVIEQIQSGRFDGVLAIGPNDEICEWFIQQSIPVVVFAGYSSYTIAIDGTPILQLGIDALAAQGCRKIGWWSKYSVDPAELKAFMDILSQHGLPYLPALSRCGTFVTGSSSQDQGYRLVMDVFGRGESEKPDGIISTDDMTTDGMLSAFEDLGIQVGSDVKIVTHANVGSPILYSREKRLIMVEIDPGEIAKAMMEQLGILLAGETPKEPIIIVKPKLRMNTP
jgi:DNA-binding LacI/PurR family transcriptional regulator